MDSIQKALSLLSPACLIALILILPSPLWSEETAYPGFSLDLQLDKETFSLSDEMTVHLKASHPSGFQLDRPALRRGLIEYFGYGQPPFSLLSETVTKSSDKETWIEYQLSPSKTGRFPIGFGVVLFKSKESEKPVILLSPLKPVTITPAKEAAAFTPPDPTFLFLSPLLPVEIDPMERHRLMGSKEILEGEKRAWRNLFFLRKMPTLVFVLGSFLLIILMLFFAVRFMRGKKQVVKGRSARTILKGLLEEMQLIRSKHRSGLCSSNDALVFYQKAMVECFELKFQMPLASMTVEELKERLGQESTFEQTKEEDLAQLLEASLGIKFGKKVVQDQEAGSMMDRSLSALKNIVKSLPK